MKLNPWPVSITLFIAAVIGAVVAFGVYASRNKTDLVAPDYYDQEIRYQQHIDGTRRALRLDSGPVIKVEGRKLNIAVPNYASATGMVMFYRPSDSALDQTFPLALGGDGQQTMDISALASGPWRFRVTWVVSNESFIVETLNVL